MKLKTQYICSNCGHTEGKWQGKCSNCGAWNSYVEETINVGKDLPNAPMLSNANGLLKPQSIKDVLKDVESSKEPRIYEFSAPLLTSFWGGGLVAGSLTLLAGEPGQGKSTLALQLLRALHAQNPNLTLLYITAEESEFELARRSKRLQIPDSILIVQSNNFEQIQQLLNALNPDVVIIDSIQTVSISTVPSSPGSVSQVSTLTNNFLAISKSKNISIILVGHVTKEGQIAGPKTLEHMVDSVMMLEAEDNVSYRTLTFQKHRFGTTSTMLLMKMEETGLQIVTDPSLALLENLETGMGVVYGMSIDKDLPLVVEVQALVGNPNFVGEGKSFGRREAIGVKTSKLNTILAIAEKYLNISLKNQDVYLQITGLPKNADDDSLDLPILLAILSSLKNQPISQIVETKMPVKPQKYIFAGRLTLSGKIRNATQLEQRETTSKKLGFVYNQRITAGELGSLFR
jgi:DNA repair protein RadA/Sms